MSVARSRLLHVHHAGQLARAHRRVRRRLARAAAGSVAAAGLGLALSAAPVSPAAASSLAAARRSPAAEAAARASLQQAATPAPASDAAPSPADARGPAYWLAGSDGGVFAFADAAYAGGAAGSRLNAPIAGMAATPDGRGYWLVGRDGGVFTFGDAPFFGGLSGSHLNAPIVAMATTPDGGGYWLVGSDGGVFAFGDAPYLGGVAGNRLNAPVAAIAVTPSGHGYWLAGSDGGVFTFGDAGFAGGLSSNRLNAPITGIAALPDGTGYWLAGADGGVFSFGRAPYLGGLSGQQLKGHIAGVAGTWDGAGYWLVGSDGGVFSFGDAGSYGSLGGASLTRPVVAIAAGLAPARALPPPRLLGSAGFDISWPQCPADLPGTHAFGIVGVTGGQEFTVNPCLLTEHHWALSGAAAGVYMNLSPLAPGTRQAIIGPAGVCLPVDMQCQGRNYGANGVLAAFDAARATGADHAPVWWLDVETANAWPGDLAVNQAVVRGAIDELAKLGRQSGVYSTGYQWSRIVGDFRPGVPVWLAGAEDLGQAASWCASPSQSFTGGPIWLVQLLPGHFDQDLACPAAMDRSQDLFSYPALPPIPVVKTGPTPTTVPSTTVAPPTTVNGVRSASVRSPGVPSGDQELVQMLAQIAGTHRPGGDF